MPRHQVIHDPVKFEEAKTMVNRDGLSIHKAAKETGIPYTTLRDHINGQYADYDTQFGPNRLLSQDEEDSLVNYATFMSSRGVPLTRMHIKRLASDILIQADKSNDVKTLSDKWLRMFLKRHTALAVRKSHPLQNERVCVTQDIVDEYFTLLSDTLDQLALTNDPTRIYNCDESGFSRKMNSSKKVIVPKATRHAYQSIVNLSGHITMLNAISAAGQTLPPLLIYSQQLPRNYDDGLPDSWMFRATESGYINSDIFLEWFRSCFVPHIGNRRPVLLILDNHSTHVTKAFVDAAREHQVDLLYIPSHSSHMLQPQDAGYFHVVKQRVADLAIQLGYLGMKTLPRGLFPKVLLQALNQISGATVAASFRCTGIYPFNQDAVKALLPTAKDMPSSSPNTSSKHCAVEAIPSTSTSSACACGGATKENALVKLGIVSRELANILLEPPTCALTSKSKRKNFKKARAICAEPAKKKPKVTRPVATLSPIPSPTRSLTQESDDDVLCQVCMMPTRVGFFWVGCDTCDRWYHYECLPAYIQTEVDLSLVTGTAWHCRECTEE